jgi:hypothetical protein
MMQTAALPSTDVPGDELRYVTEHFRDLQGLRFAPFWTAGLLVSIVLPFFPLSRSHVVMLVIGFLALAAIWIPWSHAWYRRNYGTIEAPVRRQSAPGLRIVFIAFLIVFLIVFIRNALFSSLDRYPAAFNLWLVLFWMLPICFYAGPPTLRIRLRCVLYRAGCLILFFIPGSITFLHPSKWLVISSICGTLLVLSLYDHWLLRHFLHPGTPEVSSE